jgi:hypothetical protein
MFVRRTLITAIALSTGLLLLPRDGSAACVNKFLSRTEGNKQIVTLLTGKLTFDEAKTMASAIGAGQAAPIEWVNDSGRTVARQFGAIKVVRPMPVGCDGKTSGSVVVVTFMIPSPPSKKLMLKLDPTTTVPFEEQSE